jgi:hypothetical protein
MQLITERDQSGGNTAKKGSAIGSEDSAEFLDI